MTVQQFLKGLFMAIISVVVVAFSQTPINYALMVLTIIATVLAYTGKNLITVLHSDSEPTKFSFINFISALLILISTGILESLAMLVTEGVIQWVVLLKVVGSVTLTYIATTLFAPPTPITTKK